MIYLFSSFVFFSQFFFGITMGKVIAHIYKYDHRNWPYPSSNTTLVIPKCSYPYIQTQRNSASDASAGGNDVESSGLYQSNNHHGDTDGKDNNDLQSYETPRENSCQSSYFGDSIKTTITLKLYTLPPPGK